MNNNDRTYWRCCDNKRLIEEARDSGHELAIALGERLEEYEHQAPIIDDLMDENKRLEHLVDTLRDEIEELRSQLGLD